MFFNYQQNALVCLPQDLHCLYVYWDFTPERIDTLKDFLSYVHPNMTLAIRLMRDNKTLLEKKIDINDLEYGGCYFGNLENKNNYYVELGAKAPDGKFVLLYRTQEINMQPLERDDESKPSEDLMPIFEWIISDNQQPFSNFSWS